MVSLYGNIPIVLEIQWVEKLEVGLLLSELISMEISSMKQSGDQELSPDVQFSQNNK